MTRQGRFHPSQKSYRRDNIVPTLETAPVTAVGQGITLHTIQPPCLSLCLRLGYSLGTEDMVGGRDTRQVNLWWSRETVVNACLSSRDNLAWSLHSCHYMTFWASIMRVYTEDDMPFSLFSLHLSLLLPLFVPRVVSERREARVTQDGGEIRKRLSHWNSLINTVSSRFPF